MIEDIERLLAERIGLDPDTVGDGLIERAIVARMAANGLLDRAEYERLLARSEPEKQALVEELVIPESWFFRDDRPFNLLRDHALTGWGGNSTRSPLRALSVPCANGEEPYSIAISLLDAGLAADRFRVDAVDVSQRCLDRARAGVYGTNAFRGGLVPTKSDHFWPVPGGIEVVASVRASVTFHLGNLLDLKLFEGQPPFDVVFCRNLLIYFDPPARAKAFAALDRLLAVGGFLFLGHADRSSDATRFESIDDRGAFAFRRASTRPAEASAIDRPARPPSSNGSIRPVPIAPRTIPVAPKAKPISPPSRAEVLEAVRALADGGRYVEATRAGEKFVRDRGPSAEAYYLLGTIRQASGDRKGAEADLQKAVYLDGQHFEALALLAVLARKRGDGVAESAYLRRADRARARKGTS